jgi:general secretion pathway protein M
MTRLGRSEKRLVLLASVVVCGILLTEFVITPVAAHKKKVETRLARATADQTDLRLLSRELGGLKARASGATAKLDSRPQGFNLFSHLEVLAGEAGVKPFLKSMNPSTSPVPDSPYRRSQVELKLERIGMDLVMGFLYKIESQDNGVYVRRVKITETGKGEPYVDAVLHVVTLERAG